MPTSYSDVNVKCPFYAWNDSRSIACEPLLSLDDELPTIRKFRQKDVLRCVMNELCCASYQNCEYYQMLMRKKYYEV